jgi:multidrug transporter EmrE-like cation transporter
MNTPTVIILLVLFCAFLGSAGQVFFKLASRELTSSPFSWISNWKFILGIFLYAVSAILFVWSLKQGNLSVLYPVIATSYIWVSIFSFFILKEPFPVIKWLGIGLIIAGIIMITQ